MAGCSEVESQTAQLNTPKSLAIPLPDSNSAVDPNVAKLFQKTVSDLQVDIQNPKLWMVHGSALFANAYYHESAEALRQAITLNPKMPQATYLMATALWRANKQEEAITALQQALTLMPKYDMGWRLLAEWQLERGETLEAEVSARIAFELNPARIGTRYLLAQSLMDEGKYEEALALLEQAIETDKAPPWIFKLAANCYRQSGDKEKMESAIAHSGSPFVDWPDPMFQHIPSLIAGKAELTEYALQLFKVNGPKKSMEFLIRAFKINPQSTDLRVALSLALQDAGQLQQSKQVLEELTGEPNTNYWKQFASVCIATSQLEKAQEYINNALALDLGDPNAHDIAAVIALELGATQKAVLHWEEAGKQYNTAEKWNKAEMSLAYAIENGSESVEALQSLGLAQVQLGHTLQANISIKKLLEKNPNDAVALELQTMLSKE